VSFGTSAPPQSQLLLHPALLVSSDPRRAGNSVFGCGPCAARPGKLVACVPVRAEPRTRAAG
jgi:hypothetical protein